MNPINCSTINNQMLSDHIIVNQMVLTSGCTYEQAKQLLILTEWRLEAAIDLFFNERTIPIPCKLSELMVPANTPSTPPNFPETLLAFGKLSSSEAIITNDNQITLSSSPIKININVTDQTHLFTKKIN